MATAPRRQFIPVLVLLFSVGCLGCGQADMTVKHEQRQSPVLTSATSEQTVAPADSMAAAQAEAQTLQRGIAQRQPNEPDSSFLKRILPVSFPKAHSGSVVAYAWRPTSFGKQLFFSIENSDDYTLALFILDPFELNTYAVRTFDCSMADYATAKAIFFIDIDQDGRKELLVLTECDLREPVKGDDGEVMYGRFAHYQTHIFGYTASGKDKRPQYREDLTPRPCLDELPTAAAVRQAIIKHQRKTDKRHSLSRLSKIR